MDYEELVQKNQAGEISDLEFLDETARKWLLQYENDKLYGHGDSW